MMAALQRHFPAEAKWSRPEGGLFVWVTLPHGFDGHELFVAGRDRGVLYSRGELFHSDGGGRNAMRITYSAAPLEQIERGIETLGTLVKERLDRTEPEGRDAIEAMPIL